MSSDLYKDIVEMLVMPGQPGLNHLIPDIPPVLCCNPGDIPAPSIPIVYVNGHVLLKYQRAEVFPGFRSIGLLLFRGIDPVYPEFQLEVVAVQSRKGIPIRNPYNLHLEGLAI